MKITRVLLAAIIFGIFEQGCGVRGDPVPPQHPPELGRGQPTYKGATEDLAFPSVPPVYAPKTINKNKKDENEKK